MKIKLFYHWRQYEWQTVEQGELSVASYDCTRHDQNCTLLKVEEVEVPDCIKPSEEDVRSGLVNRFEQEKQTILAETHRKVAILDEKIRQLTCIENLEPA